MKQHYFFMVFVTELRFDKDWINNMAKKNHVAANTVLQNYMMERFLERVAISQ